MTENNGWSAQIRAQQAVAAGNVRRLREKIDGFTMFKVGSKISYPQEKL